MALGPEDLALIGQEMVPVEKETERDRKPDQKSQKNEKVQESVSDSCTSKTSRVTFGSDVSQE